jgi:hypothetical protein
MAAGLARGRRTRGAAQHPTGTLYEIGAIARAHGVSRAVLKSWCEQEILLPTAEARGTGSRRWFDRPTAIKAGVLVEMRRLLGPRFRPGELAPFVTELDDVVLDRKGDPTPVGLVLTRKGDALAVQPMPLEADKLVTLATRHPGFIVVNLTKLTERLSDMLEE